MERFERSQMFVYLSSCNCKTVCYSGTISFRGLEISWATIKGKAQVKRYSTTTFNK